MKKWHVTLKHGASGKTKNHDWMNIPYWALDALHDYLTGKD